MTRKMKDQTMKRPTRMEILFQILSVNLVLTAVLFTPSVYGENFTPLSTLHSPAFSPATSAGPEQKTESANPFSHQKKTDSAIESPRFHSDLGALLNGLSEKSNPQINTDNAPIAEPAVLSDDSVNTVTTPSAVETVKTEETAKVEESKAEEDEPAIRIIKAPVRPSAGTIQTAVAEQPIQNEANQPDDLLPYSFPVEQAGFQEPAESVEAIVDQEADQKIVPDTPFVAELPEFTLEAVDVKPQSTEVSIAAADSATKTEKNVSAEITTNNTSVPNQLVSQPVESSQPTAVLSASVPAQTAAGESKQTLPEQLDIPAPIIPESVPNVIDVSPKKAQISLPLYPQVEGANPQSVRDDPEYDQFRSEMLGEIEKHAWRTGNFQVIPYGFFWASMSYETRPSQIGSAPFFEMPPSNTGSQTHADYRGSIFGFNVRGPQMSMFPNAKINAKLEFDLQRTIDYENKATVHLRHCYVEAVSNEGRILIGQTWDIISPLIPGTIMYSAGWLDGNVGYRRCQFRLERFLNVSPCMQWKLQACLAAPFAGCDTSEMIYDGQNYRIKDGSYPMVQGRIAAVVGCRNQKQKPIEIGFAGHFGEIQYGELVPGAEDNNYSVKTWGMYLDAYIPFNDIWGVQGELFKGENISMFHGGIGQGITLGADGRPEAVKTQGGWINLWLNITDKLQYRVGYMIDDPSNSFEHMSGYAVRGRALNHSLFTNFKYNVTPQWWVGAEYSHVETTWVGSDPGVSAGDRVDLVSYFGF